MSCAIVPRDIPARATFDWAIAAMSAGIVYSSSSTTRFSRIAPMPLHNRVAVDAVSDGGPMIGPATQASSRPSGCFHDTATEVR